jgi:diaminopimelate decarboxylase
VLTPSVGSQPPETGRIAPLRAALTVAARRFGTPLYVVDMAVVAEAATQVESAFNGAWLLHYSLKANDLPPLTAFLHSRGWGASVVSTGEWQHARQAGVPNEALVFEGIGKTDAQLDYAAREAAAGRPVRWLALESAEEAVRLADLAARHGLGQAGRPRLDVLVRLNPDAQPETRAEFAVGAGTSKFGMSQAEIRDLARRGVLASEGLRLRGVHVHVGSDLEDVRAWAAAGLQATRMLAELAELIPAAMLDTVDFGGGFPVTSATAPPPARFAAALGQALAAEGLALPARPAIEPGRFLVGGAGWLVSSVLHRRNGRTRQGGRPPGQQVVLDAGMTELIRPALYGSRHPVHALAGTPDAAPSYDTALEGPVCESTDSFGSYRLPPLHRGDLVAIEAAGAYAASFTSRYNGRPPPAEALLWPDGSLQRCGRPVLAPLELAEPGMPGDGAAEPGDHCTDPLHHPAPA